MQYDRDHLQAFQAIVNRSGIEKGTEDLSSKLMASSARVWATSEGLVDLKRNGDITGFMGAGGYTPVPVIANKPYYRLTSRGVRHAIQLLRRGRLYPLHQYLSILAQHNLNNNTHH